MKVRSWLLVLSMVSVSLGAPHPSAVADDESDERSGFLANYLAARPPSPKPWHKYGTFYYNIGVGASMYGDHTDANNDGSLSSIDARDTGFNYQLRAGFAGKYVGTELGWLDLGNSKFDATSDGSGDSWIAGDVSAKVEVSGWTLAGLLRLPIQERWVMLARIGLLGWSSTETFTETSGGSTITSTDEDSGTSALFGVGFEYDIYNLKHFWLATEFTRAKVDNDDLPVNMFSGSVVYHY